jgi:hypothetical protein
LMHFPPGLNLHWWWCDIFKALLLSQLIVAVHF